MPHASTSTPTPSRRARCASADSPRASEYRYCRSSPTWPPPPRGQVVISEYEPIEAFALLADDDLDLALTYDYNLAPASPGPVLETVPLWCIPWGLGVPGDAPDAPADVPHTPTAPGSSTRATPPTRTRFARLVRSPASHRASRTRSTAWNWSRTSSSRIRGWAPADRSTHRRWREGIPLGRPEVVLTAYAVTRIGRATWPPLRVVLDRLRRHRERYRDRVGHDPPRASDECEAIAASGRVGPPLLPLAGLGRPEVAAGRALQVYYGATVAQQVLPVRVAIACARTVPAVPALITAGARHPGPAGTICRRVNRQHAGPSDQATRRPRPIRRRSAAARRRGRRTTCRTPFPPLRSLRPDPVVADRGQHRGAATRLIERQVTCESGRPWHTQRSSNSEVRIT